LDADGRYEDVGVFEQRQEKGFNLFSHVVRHELRGKTLGNKEGDRSAFPLS
jgi:hypothetical protein